MVDVLKKEVQMSFDNAVEHVNKILQEEGFSVLLTKSIDEIFKQKFNINNYPRYTTILACSPKLAKMALDVSFNVGSLFPCSFVVYEENEKIVVSHVSIMKIAKEVGLASPEAMEPVIDETGKMIQKVWNRI